MEMVIRQDLVIQGWWLNAAGSFGFAPPSIWPLPDPPAAFVTNPISYRPRQAADDRALIEFPGGFLLHTGWPNPGFRAVMKQYAVRWGRSQVPVWVNLLGGEASETQRMVQQLEEIEGVAAVQLSLPPLAGENEILELVSAAVGEIPLVVCVSIQRFRESWVRKLAAHGVSAISLSPPRGTLPRFDGQLVTGRLFGQAIFPLMVQAVREMHETPLPILAGGGAYSRSQVQVLRQAGAVAVELDSVLWTHWNDR